MALIICPECGQSISNQATICIHCGFPLKKETTKIAIKASRDFMGLGCFYAVLDENNQEIGRIIPGSTFEFFVDDANHTYYINSESPIVNALMPKRKDNARNLSKKKLDYEMDKTNRFSVGYNQLRGIIISKVDNIDSID